MFRNFAIVSFAVFALVAISDSDALAQNNVRLRPQTPIFGFSSYTTPGGAMIVTSVVRYSAADRLGLEPGDALVGATTSRGYYRLGHGGWGQAVREAHGSNGYIKLSIIDTRTGREVTRYTNTRYWHGG